MSCFVLTDNDPIYRLRSHYKVLHGSDSDVSASTFVYCGEHIVMHTIYFNECHDGTPENGPAFHFNDRFFTRDEFEKFFESQLGAPMQCISEEAYRDFMRQSW